MPLHDTSYQHWQGAHLGLWRRRWAIARNGLTGCLANRWMRHLVVVCWVAGLVMAGILFLVGQLLVADSIVLKWTVNLGPAPQAFTRMLTTWLEQHPEISVRTTQNVLFYFFCKYLLRGSIFALGMAIPGLISRDLASNAIVIYSSKAVSRSDYFLGKLGTCLGLLTVTWLGPLCGAWFVGNLLAPDWGFFWHSRAALGNAVLFVLVAMMFLSVLALGVSAISTQEKSTAALWFVWWILGGVVAPIAIQTRPWLQHFSFNYNLNQLALAVFRLGSELKSAQDNIPVLGEMLRSVRPEVMQALSSPATTGALVALALMIVGASVILWKRVRPE